MTISIRPVTTIQECRIIEQLQMDVWMCDAADIVPDNAMLTLAKEGCIVLLVYDDDAPIGFAFGFVGFTADNTLKYASHMVGVIRAYQGKGIGYQLKLVQREIALARGIKLMTWTFDPLQSRNARFNLKKLGAVCNSFFPNLYGAMNDGLNLGMDSDRFRVDWWMESDYVADHLGGQFPESSSVDEYQILNPATLLPNNLLAPSDTFANPAGTICLVEIPANIDVLKAQDLNLAIQWRHHTREIFTQLFEAGYTAINFLRHRQQERVYYQLKKDWSIS